MKESYWGYWIIILGIFIIGVMLLVNSTTTNSTNDYYTLKEVTHASMVDAIDMAYYRLYGNVKMSEEKFVENFIRRFADNTNLSNTYNVEFYDLYEVPPKVSVKVSTKSGTYNVANEPTSFDVTNTIDAILEFDFTKDSNSNFKPCSIFICPSFISDYYSKGTSMVGYDTANKILGSLDIKQKQECLDAAINGGSTSYSQCPYVTEAFNNVFPGLDSTPYNEFKGNYEVLLQWEKAGYIFAGENKCQ